MDCPVLYRRVKAFQNLQLVSKWRDALSLLWLYSNYVVLRLSQTPWLELTQISPSAIKTSVIIPRIQIKENVSSYQLIWLEWGTIKRNEKNIISLLKNVDLALWPWCALNMRFTDDCFMSPWMMQHS
jgi:hypothetical protein